ncbi:hypothetical protein ABT300_28745 [Streptomyces sp. NPDC001027]
MRVAIDRLVIRSTAPQPADDAPAARRQSRTSLEEYLGRRS